MDYTEIRKLDEFSSRDLQESNEPADECICNIFTSRPSSEPGKGVKASIRKVFGAISKSKSKLVAITGRGKSGGEKGGWGAKSINIPFRGGAPGFIHTARRVLNRKKGECGKCSCDSQKIYLKDSDFRIRITTPDIDLDALCPCMKDCMPDKAKLQDNIKVTIEHAEAPEVESVWRQRSLDFLDRSIKSCIELTSPVKTVDRDKPDMIRRLPAIELIKSINKEPSLYAMKRDTLAFQKLPTISIGSSSINSNSDETSEVVVLVDEENYEQLFKHNTFSKEVLSHVFRNRSDSS